MMVGIGLLATLITKIAELALQRTQKRMKGLLQLNLENHIVILGWNERTGAVIKEILANTPDEHETILLCSKTVTENPLPGTIEFVHGCPAHDETLEKGCVNKAKNIIVYGADDNKTLAYGIAANRINNSAHIVAYFCDEENAKNLKRVNGRIECVTSVAVSLLVHAMSDPGSAAIISNLSSHTDVGTQYRLNVPLDFEGASFSEILCHFHYQHDAILIGFAESWKPEAKVILNPKGGIIGGGMSLFYIADERLENVNWQEI